MFEPLLMVDGVEVTFATAKRRVRAVAGVSFSIGHGEVVGLVGESGCGKSVTCAALLRLVPTPPGSYDGGRVLLEGRDLWRLSPEELRSVRGKRIGMVFQDPASSLNPCLRIGEQLIEGLRSHEKVSRRAARSAASEMLRDVGLADATARLESYPHELSGGMRQRVMLAMALLIRPTLLIADEPTTALDATVQAQVLERIARARRDSGMAVLLVTHDLGVVAGLCDRVLVMYAGSIVESAPTLTLFRAPKHPYTRALLRATPDLEKGARLPAGPAQLVPPAPESSGCSFAPRCEHAIAACQETPPPVREVAAQQESRCLRVQREGLAP